jgi:IMP dehydrogenase
LESIIDCARTEHNVAIIADGGIKNSGDIAKALAARADFAMIGSILAGTDCTPGKIILSETGERRKVYRGMASKDAQIDWRGKSSSLEGISTTVPYKGPTFDIIEQLENGIRSAFSYSGARTINEYWAKAQFVRQSGASIGESRTHILERNH